MARRNHLHSARTVRVLAPLSHIVTMGGLCDSCCPRRGKAGMYRDKPVPDCPFCGIVGGDTPERVIFRVSDAALLLQARARACEWRVAKERAAPLTCPLTGPG